MVLDAIAHSQTGNIVVTTDAKRGELFFAKYSAGVRLEGPEVIAPEALVVPSGFSHVSKSCDAVMVGEFAIAALAEGRDLSDVSALYLRSADVSPSKGKRVTG
jgi:tRNA A37 threonylcarbamoyladenosine modification protein TsaB